MRIAKVAVAAAVYAIDKPYDYQVPEALSEGAVPGVRVAVPFGQGNRRTEGVILSAEEAAQPDKPLKQLLSVLDPAPVLDGTMLRMAAFMRERYFCTFFEAIQAMLPPGLWFHAKDTYVLTALGATAEESRLQKRPEALKVLRLLRDLGGQAPAGTLKSSLDRETLETGLKYLSARQMVFSEGTLLRNVADRTEQIAVLAVDPEEAAALAKTKRNAPLQKAVLEQLIVLGRCAVKELRYFTGAPLSSIRALERAGYLELRQQETFRRPARAEQNPVEIRLSREQEEAFLALRDTLGKAGEVSLLYGVTGSGKTLVYLRLIEDCLAMGKTALVLVPEIALTPQLLQVFMTQFGDRVAILHSALKAGERYDEWKRIRSGSADVVLGTRSAVFAPLRDLGLIVVDEEHEHTYKSETNPRYHARELAIWRGYREKAAVVLGSATPSMESMFLAKNGTYRLLRLTERYGDRPMPRVVLTDMKEELRNGNSSAISQLLREEIDLNLERGEQTILYLNRRGASRIVLCPVCGHVPACPRCSVNLTYHSANGRLMCHYCGHSEHAAAACPECGSTCRQVGAGTQRVEEEVRQLWPGVETLRMDADTVSAANPHDKLLGEFQQKNIPILIGTQMVTKGLNFPNVTLVGVLDGDAALYSGDFRASENAFSKITQVVGRAGRGENRGRAVIQTVTPENQVLLQAASQDYDAFYDAELPLRQVRSCPPFADVLRIKFSGAFEGDVSQGAHRFRHALGQTLREGGWDPDKLTILGPAPAAVVKVMNRYHYQLTVLTKNTRELRSLLSELLKWFARDKRSAHVTAYIDVNPLE